ncbi:MAG: hypothetical protein GXP27_14710 [Planctomycetes bacterium]|nr:hypothetical protein [Planctomycetota bacterium]
MELLPEFPRLDPIPLPAPVWLFKTLEVVTVSLHLIAVQLLLSGLIVGTVWTWTARRRRDPLLTEASGTIARLLPIVMIYVINLGVPPLLFAQVLYGRALYTSSILMGGFWISVILLLMLVYSLLYLMASRAKKGIAWGWVGLIAFVVAAKIAVIYSSNMTLMLRPQVWAEMYRGDPYGLHMNSGDATVWPRWLYIVLGGLSVGGAGLLLLGLSHRLQDQTARFVRQWGARLMLVGAGLQLLVGLWVYIAQPTEVRESLGTSGWFVAFAVAWVLLSLALIGTGYWVHGRVSERDVRWPLLGAGVCFSHVLAMVLVRATIRDRSLLVHGFDVWDRQVTANWTVVILFLVLFVAALVAMGWLIRVFSQARGVEGEYV